MRKHFLSFRLFQVLFFALVLSTGCTKHDITAESRKKSMFLQEDPGGEGEGGGSGGGGPITPTPEFSPSRWVVADNFVTSQDGNLQIEVKIWADEITTEHIGHLEVPVDPDFVITGGGARIRSKEAKTPDQGINALLTAMYPVDDNQFNKFAASSKDHFIPFAHRLIVYAIGLKVFYYSGGSYTAFPASTLKSQMHISRSTVPFAIGQYVYSGTPDPLNNRTLCGGARLIWPAQESGLLLTAIATSHLFGGGAGKDHAITTLGGSTETYNLYIENHNPLDPSRYLLDMSYGINNDIGISGDATQSHETIVESIRGWAPSQNNFLIASLAGEVTYGGYGRMLYSLFPLDGTTAVISSKDHMEVDISGHMYMDAIGIRPAY
ncbi:MAG: hypothetical protein ABI581_12340 [Sediminibacterium sp.]